MLLIISQTEGSGIPQTGYLFSQFRLKPTQRDARDPKPYLLGCRATSSDVRDRLRRLKNYAVCRTSVFQG
jgi:hypothetical protein